MHHLKFSFKPGLYQKLEQNNLLKLDFIDRLETLYSQGFLEAIHLDYLLKENIIGSEDYEVFMSRNANAA